MFCLWLQNEVFASTLKFWLSLFDVVTGLLLIQATWEYNETRVKDREAKPCVAIWALTYRVLLCSLMDGCRRIYMRCLWGLQDTRVSTRHLSLHIFQKKNKGIIMVTFNADVLACGRKVVNVSTLAGLKLIYCSFCGWLLWISWCLHHFWDYVN